MNDSDTALASPQLNPAANLPVLDLEYEPGSYRDQSGRIFYYGGLVYRALTEPALEDFKQLAAKSFFLKLIDERKIVRTELTTGDGLPARF